MLKPSWESVINAFISSRLVSGKSKETLSYYKIKLSAFHSFHINANIPCSSPVECTRECVENFFSYLISNGRRKVTVHSYFRALRALFRWLIFIGLRNDNPLEKVIPPKVEEPLPKTVTEEHFLVSIKQITSERFKNHLNYLTLFVLLYDTGMRLSEALNLKIEDVDLQRKLVKVTGKGNKQRIVPISPRTCSLLMKLISRRISLGANLEDFLFITSNGTSFSRRNIHRVWKKIQLTAGLKPLPVHGLRHGFARSWLISGGDSFSLQIILGHSSPEVTQRYVKFFGSDLQKLHQRHSPIEKLKFELKEAKISHSDLVKMTY